MIQKLITRIVETLSSSETGLGADFPAAGSIVAGPLPPDQEPQQVPAIVVAMGRLAINQRYRDAGSHPPRAQEGREARQVREFQQQLWVDVYANSMAESERWAALLIGALLTRPDDLLRSDSEMDAPDYQAGAMRSYHLLNDLTLLEGSPQRSAQLFCMHLVFQVTGTLHLTRTLTEAPALIERIELPDSDTLINPG